MTTGRPGPDPFGLSGRTIVVTGAAGILGPPLCRGLLDAGATVVGLDRDREALGRVVVGEGHADRWHHRRCDVSEEDDVVDVVAALWRDLGPVDGLLNNAASKSSSLDGFFADFEVSTLATWREVSAVNLDGSYLMAREVGRRMVEVGSGSIIQIASIYGIVGPDQRIYEGSDYLGRQISSPAVYSATKAGVLGLVRHLATLWGAAGVRINAVTPGGVSSGQNDVFDRKYSNRVPLGRMAQPDDLVGPVTFLFSDAARYVTGHNLVVDGGLTAW